MSHNESTKIFEKIGEGTYSKVRRCVMNSETLAVKMMPLDSANCMDTPIIREIVSLYTLRGLSGVLQGKSVDLISKPTCNIYLEFFSGGNMCEFLSTIDANPNNNNKKILPEEKQKFQFTNPVHCKHALFQLIQSLRNIHRKKMIHRDIKPHNILFELLQPKEEHGIPIRLCIADFGLSRICNTNMNMNMKNDSKDNIIISTRKLKENIYPLFMQELTTHVYTRCWRPPEIWLGCDYNQTADVWALGLVFLQLIQGTCIGSKLETEKEKSMEQLVEFTRLFGTPVEPLVADICNRKPYTLGLSWTDIENDTNYKLNGGAPYEKTHIQNVVETIRKSYANMRDNHKFMIWPSISIICSRYHEYLLQWKSIYTARELSSIIVDQCTTSTLTYDQELLASLLQKMLHFNPRKRFTSEQLYNHPYFDDIRSYYKEDTTTNNNNNNLVFTEVLEKDIQITMNDIYTNENRYILLEWLYEFSGELDIDITTVREAIRIIDFCAPLGFVRKEYLQRLAINSLVISANLHNDSKVPLHDDCVRSAARAYSIDEIVQGKHETLQFLIMRHYDFTSLQQSEIIRFTKFSNLLHNNKLASRIFQYYYSMINCCHSYVSFLGTCFAALMLTKKRMKQNVYFVNGQIRIRCARFERNGVQLFHKIRQV
jgi:serine/threonine protein kinase